MQKHWLTFKQGNMKDFPIVSMNNIQKSDLSDLVDMIIKNPNNLDVPDIEEEINPLVHELYDFTTSEIKVIEEVTTQ